MAAGTGEVGREKEAGGVSLEMVDRTMENGRGGTTGGGWNRESGGGQASGSGIGIIRRKKSL